MTRTEPVLASQVLRRSRLQLAAVACSTAIALLYLAMLVTHRRDRSASR